MAGMATRPDLVVIHEHPEWQKPLFAALERRGLAYAAFDLKQAAFSNLESPTAKVYFNQASPSAYVRGNTRARPGIHANAEAARRACPERRRCLRPRVEQERTSHAAAHTRHRYAVVDHLQRRHRSSRVRRQDSMAGHTPL